MYYIYGIVFTSLCRHIDSTASRGRPTPLEVPHSALNGLLDHGLGHHGGDNLVETCLRRLATTYSLTELSASKHPSENSS